MMYPVATSANGIKTPRIPAYLPNGSNVHISKQYELSVCEEIRNGKSLKDVTPQSEEICFEGVSKDPESLLYCFKHFARPCMKAVSMKSSMIKHVRYKDMSSQQYVTICNVAVMDDVNNLQYIPKKYQYPKMCLYAVEHEIRTLQYVKAPDDDTWHKLLALTPIAIKYMRMLTAPTVSMYMYAVKHHPEALAYIDPKVSEYDDIKAVADQASLEESQWDDVFL
jgi:hypothetical protein